MANWFYYDNDGRKQGPITAVQIKELAAQGIIVPTTRIATRRGQESIASMVQGLEFPQSVPDSSLQNQQNALKKLLTHALPVAFLKLGKAAYVLCIGIEQFAELYQHINEFEEHLTERVNAGAKTIKKKKFWEQNKRFAELGKLLYEGHFVDSDPSFAEEIGNIRKVQAEIAQLQRNDSPDLENHSDLDKKGKITVPASLVFRAVLIFAAACFLCFVIEYFVQGLLLNSRVEQRARALEDELEQALEETSRLKRQANSTTKKSNSIAKKSDPNPQIAENSLPQDSKKNQIQAERQKYAEHLFSSVSLDPRISYFFSDSIARRGIVLEFRGSGYAELAAARQNKDWLKMISLLDDKQKDYTEYPDMPDVDRIFRQLDNTGLHMLLKGDFSGLDIQNQPSPRGGRTGDLPVKKMAMVMILFRNFDSMSKSFQFENIIGDGRTNSRRGGSSENFAEIDGTAWEPHPDRVGYYRKWSPLPVQRAFMVGDITIIRNKCAEWNKYISDAVSNNRKKIELGEIKPEVAVERMSKLYEMIFADALRWCRRDGQINMERARFIERRGITETFTEQ